MTHQLSVLLLGRRGNGWSKAQSLGVHTWQATAFAPRAGLRLWSIKKHYRRPGFRRQTVRRPRMLMATCPGNGGGKPKGAGAALPGSPEGDVAAVGPQAAWTLGSPAAASSSSPSSPLWAEEAVAAAGELAAEDGGRGGGARVWSQAGQCYWSSAVSWRRPEVAERYPSSAMTYLSESSWPGTEFSLVGALANPVAISLLPGIRVRPLLSGILRFFSPRTSSAGAYFIPSQKLH